MSLTSIRSAAGIALLAVIAAGCGTAAAVHPASTPSKKASPTAAATHPTAQSKVNMAPRNHRPGLRKVTPVTPAAPPQNTPPTTMAPAPQPTTQAPPPTTTAPAPAPTTSNPIPQNDGGDHDADNNGGPSDGDGNI
jgi:hypothetical protein